MRPTEFLCRSCVGDNAQIKGASPNLENLMSDIAVVSEASYPTQVLQAEGPVLVKFGSKTCGPCMMLGAALKDIAPDYGDEIKLFDVDVEEAPGIAKQYGIVTIPVLLFLRNGEVQKRVMGNQTRGKLSQMIDAHIEGGN